MHERVKLSEQHTILFATVGFQAYITNTLSLSTVLGGEVANDQKIAEGNSQE